MKVGLFIFTATGFWGGHIFEDRLCSLKKFFFSFFFSFLFFMIYNFRVRAAEIFTKGRSSWLLAFGMAFGWLLDGFSE